MFVLGGIAAAAYVLQRRRRGARRSITCTRSSAAAPTQVFAADGSLLGFIQSDELRTPVGWNEIPGDLKNATVAIEDQRFYKDNGVDLTGIFRAAVKDITHGAALQGGSTITMQLMRNLYLGGDQHTLKQKIIEAKLAIEYDEETQQPLDPHQLSEQRPLRHRRRADGRRRAGRLAGLLRQARLAARPRSSRALLAGPAAGALGIQPVRGPLAARQRRNEVLAKMAELHYITAAAGARRRERAA